MTIDELYKKIDSGEIDDIDEDDVENFLDTLNDYDLNVNDLIDGKCTSLYDLFTSSESMHDYDGDVRLWNDFAEENGYDYLMDMSEFDNDSAVLDLKPSELLKRIERSSHFSIDDDYYIVGYNRITSYDDASDLISSNKDEFTDFIIENKFSELNDDTNQKIAEYLIPKKTEDSPRQ